MIAGVRGGAFAEPTWALTGATSVATSAIARTLGRTIAAVARFIDQTKKKQRAPIAGHAKELLLAGIRVAETPDADWKWWDQGSEHMLKHLQKAVHTSIDDVEPTHA